MAELQSRVAANIAGNIRSRVCDTAGSPTVMTIMTPATWSGAQNDTMGSGVTIPPNCRLLANSVVSCNAGSASSTLSIGLRSKKTGTVLSATAIASGVDIAASGVKNAFNGAYVDAGFDFVTTEESEVFLTFTGANPQANQKIRVEVAYVGA